MAGPTTGVSTPDSQEKEDLGKGNGQCTEESSPETPRESTGEPVGNDRGTDVPHTGGDPASREGPERGSDVNPPKKRVGRPSKKALAAKKPGGRGKPGRPKGDAAIMNEYKARMLASPKSAKVIQKVFDVALEDGHKHQAACMKMVLDRIAPLGGFEADVRRGKAAGGINITITGVGSASVEGQEVDAVDAEWEPVGE